MLDYLKLTNVGPAPSMTVDFGDRLTLLTGDNGLGKTFALDLAWWALTRTWAAEEALPQRGPGRKPCIEYRVVGKSGDTGPTSICFDTRRQSWPLPGRRPPMPGVVLYVRVDGSYSLWDPARHYWKQASSRGVDAPDRPAAYHFGSREVWDGLEVQGKVICNGLIRDWVTWQLQEAREFKELCAALESLSPAPELLMKPGEPVRVSLDEARDIPTLEMPYGTVPITHVSAGMRRILGVAYLLVWARREHRKASELLGQEPEERLVLLFDEVETHLHPRWQRRIVPALLQTAQALGSQALQCIISTHSALVATSLEPLFQVPRDKILNFDLSGERVEVKEVPWRMRGDANAWLKSSEVFDLSMTYSIQAEEAIQEAARLMRACAKQPALSPEERTEVERVHQLLFSNLAENDPYWVRWLYFKDRFFDPPGARS